MALTPRGRQLLATIVLAASLAIGGQASTQTDALPSWNDGPAKKAIVDFVQVTTTHGSARFVPLAERIATFDQDCTRWVEHPMYAQARLAGRRYPSQDGAPLERRG